MFRRMQKLSDLIPTLIASTVEQLFFRGMEWIIHRKSDFLLLPVAVDYILSLLTKSIAFPSQ